MAEDTHAVGHRVEGHAAAARIEGRAAALRIENLDTDQIMPKQFLRGIDKAGLAQGLLYDLRFTPDGTPRPECVLNQPGYAGTRVLLGGANFGCGSSREHAVWGLQQFGIQAIIAPSFGEIFYSNAMNNRLLLVVLPEADVAALMAESERADSHVSIDVQALTVRGTDAGAHGAAVQCNFTLSARHQQMFLQGLDVIGLSLTHRAAIEAFAQRHAQQHPWMKDVAANVWRRRGMTA